MVQAHLRLAGAGCLSALKQQDGKHHFVVLKSAVRLFSSNCSHDTVLVKRQRLPCHDALYRALAMCVDHAIC